MSCQGVHKINEWLDGQIWVDKYVFFQAILCFPSQLPLFFWRALQRTWQRLGLSVEWDHELMWICPVFMTIIFQCLHTSRNTSFPWDCFFFSFFFFLLRKCCLSRWVPSIWIKITAESTFYMTLEACSRRKVTAGSQQYTFLSWKFTTLPRVSSHLSHWAGSIILVLSMVQISFLVSVGNHRKIWNVLGFWVFITV